jgi:UDP-glucose 4-epimerase
LTATRPPDEHGFQAQARPEEEVVSICLVTGGAGFIGSHLVERLVARGDRVRVLDDFRTGWPANLAAVQGQVGLVRGSVTDATLVREAVRGCDYVFHLAALPSVQRSVEDPLATHDACATGTLHVLDAARRANVRRVVYAASSSAYGGVRGDVQREDNPVTPLSPYAAAKLAGEMYCQSFTAAYGLETVRLRFFNVFGPRQRADSPYSGVIPLFIDALTRGKRPVIHADGRQSRDFTYVADAAQALEKAALAGAAASGQVYNIANGSSTTVVELVEQLNALLGTRIIPEHGPARVGDVRHSRADLTRAKRDLGYEPEVTFAEGLRRTVAAYQATPAKG